MKQKPKGTAMPVHDANMELLYGLFHSICDWAYDEGLRDISGIKNLLKLAMIDVCRKRHADQSSIGTQIAIVTDLGISLRNVQVSMKMLNGIHDYFKGFVRIGDVQKEVAVALLQGSRTLNEILSEVSYLIHAPYDLQKKMLKTILLDMIQRNLISMKEKHGVESYSIKQNQISMYHPDYLTARITGLLTHIEAYNQTQGEPYFITLNLPLNQITELQSLFNDFLRRTGDSLEKECNRLKSGTKTYYFYLGSAPINPNKDLKNISDSIIQTIYERARDVDSPSLMRTHLFKLTPERAQQVFTRVCTFIQKKGGAMSKKGTGQPTVTCAFHFGMAEKNNQSFDEEAAS